MGPQGPAPGGRPPYGSSQPGGFGPGNQPPGYGPTPNGGPGGYGPSGRPAGPNQGFAGPPAGGGPTRPDVGPGAGPRPESLSRPGTPPGTRPEGAPRPDAGPTPNRPAANRPTTEPDVSRSADDVSRSPEDITPKPDSDTPATTDPKPTTDTEPRQDSESSPATDTETKRDSEPTPATDPKPDTDQPATDTKPDTDTTPGSEPKPDSEPTPATDTRPDSEPKPETEPRPDSEPAPATDTRPDTDTTPGSEPRPDSEPTPATDTRPDSEPKPDSEPSPPADSKPDTDQPATTDTKPDSEPTPAADAKPDTDPTPDPKPDTEPDSDADTTPGSEPKPSDPTPDENNPEPIHGDDSEGPTPDDDGPPTDADDADNADDNPDTDDATDTEPVSGEPNDGPRVDENGVPLNFLGYQQGEHRFADMGEYIPMGGDRSNGMGSYDQRVAPLISDHNPWGVHGSRDEFNAHHRPDGTYQTNRWPPNDGAVAGSERNVTLPEGTVLDRFGGESGRFLSPMDTDGTPYHYRERAIFPDNAEVGYHVYVVSDPSGLPGTLADVAPALGQPGGGRQFTLPADVDVAQLLRDRVIREVHVPPNDGRVLPESFGQDRGDGTPSNDTASVDDARDATDSTDSTDTTDRPDQTDQTDSTPPDTDTTPPLPDHLQQVADNSSFRTPAGAALFDPTDTRTRDAAAAVRPIDGHFVLDVHSDGQHAYVNGQQLNGRDLAQLARNLGWNGTDPIILNGCEAGRHNNGLAADLARESGGRVIAPTERSWSGQQNTTPYSASADRVDGEGRARPTHPPDGGWREFDSDGNVRDTGSNGLPVDTRPDTPADSTTGTPGDTQGTPGEPGDGPPTTPTTDPGQPLPFGDDVDRGRIQSPFVIPPDVRNADDPVTIDVDTDAANAADPNDPDYAHRPLREGEQLIGRTGLTPDTAYHVPGRGTYYTDGSGRITHADLEVNNRTEGIHESGAAVNPDAAYPHPNTTYRIDVDGAEHTYTTDDAGLPPRYQEWTTPRYDNTVTFPSTDPNLPPNHPLVQPLHQPARGLGEALSSRTGFPPYTRIEHSTPDGRPTTLYTGAPEPPSGTARVVAIDTWSSQSATGSDSVRVSELNPELNNFPPNTVTRINGTDVYVTNEHGVTTEASDQRDYSQDAPRSDKAQKLVKQIGGSTDVDGGHIRSTQGGGHVDARNQVPQLSAENRPLGGPADQIWWNQDMAAAREQLDHGSTHEWHDFQTEGSHPSAPARPTQLHERWVMRDSHGRIRLHFRRYGN